MIPIARLRQLRSAFTLRIPLTALLLATPPFATPALAAPPPPAATTSAQPATTSGNSSAGQPATENPDPSVRKEDPTERARELFGAGVEAAEKGLWAEACTSFGAALALIQHWQIAYQLAKAEIHVGRFQSAIRHLNTVLADPDEKAQLARTEALALLAEAQSGLVPLQVQGSPAGARVFLDGEFCGKLPLVAPLQVDPGAHDVELRLGPIVTRESVVATSGQKGTVYLTVGPLGSGAPTVDASGNERSPNEPSLVPVYVLGTAAVLGVVVTGVLTGLAVSKGDEAQGLYETLSARNEPRPCTSTLCVKQDSLLGEHDTYARAALAVGIGSALLGAATGAVYLVQTRKTPGETGRAMRWTPVVSPAGGGFVIRGSF